MFKKIFIIASAVILGLVSATENKAFLKAKTQQSPCANENGTCNFEQGPDPVRRYIRYGANGQYVEKQTYDLNVPCNNDYFGSDPTPGVATSCTVYATVA